jgi:hypothetical protein
MLILAVLAGLALRTPVFAEDPPYLEFVQGLRAQGLPEYALEYLEKLSKKAPAGMAGILQLEMARARADIALPEADRSKREALFQQAKAEFQAFLTKNAKNPLAIDAHLGLAGIASFQGKALLGEADWQEQPEARQSTLDKARPHFLEATKWLDDANKLIAEQLAQPRLNDKDKRYLTEAKIRADLELGINLLHQFLTFDDQAGQQRAQVARRALDVLQKTAQGQEKNPLYWLARAWIGRYHYETQDFRSAKRELQKVIDEKGAYADQGKRIAKYVQLLLLDKDPDAKNVLDQKVKLAEQWLNDFRGYSNSPEGYGVRFQLADGYLEQGRKKPTSPDGIRLLKAAETILDTLERTENDYSRLAREKKMILILARSSDRSRGEISKLNDFPECYVRAQLEIAQLHEEEKQKPDPKAKPEDAKKKRDKHFDNIVAALERGLELVDGKSPPEDVAQARFILAHVYARELNEPYKAAILAEDLARRTPKSKAAVGAAEYALRAYSQILAEDEKEGTQADAEADRSRVKDMARYIEQTFPTEPTADLARHQLAFLMLREKNYPEAIHLFSRISPTYSTYTLCQFQLAGAAKQAIKDGVKAPKGEPPYEEVATKALEKIPDLPKTADAATAQYYFYGKLELANLLFRTKQYDKMAKLTGELTQHFNEVKDKKEKLEKSVQDEIEPTLKLLPFYSQYGKADLAFRASKYEDVLKLVDPLIVQVIQDKLPEIKNDPKVFRGLLGLAMRANVQEGNTKKAQELLELLLKQTAESDLESTSAILGELVLQLRSQVEDLRKRLPETQKELDQTVSKFSVFLDEIAKQPSESLTPDLTRFLAFSYASLQKHREAADLLGRIPAPKPDAGKDKVDLDKETYYQSIQIMHARELRLAKEHDRAKNKLKDILNTEWGKRNLDAKKELHCLWEDEGNYAAAAKGWNDMMNNVLRPLMEKNAKFKDMYYECYYHVVLCLYKNAMKLKDKKLQQENITKAANWYVKLKGNKEANMGGEGLRKLYDELLDSEPTFKKECERLEKIQQ